MKPKIQTKPQSIFDVTDPRVLHVTNSQTDFFKLAAKTSRPQEPEKPTLIPKRFNFKSSSIRSNSNFLRPL